MTRRPPLQFLVQMLEKYVRNPRVKEHSVSFPQKTRNSSRAGGWVSLSTV